MIYEGEDGLPILEIKEVSDPECEVTAKAEYTFMDIKSMDRMIECLIFVRNKWVDFLHKRDRENKTEYSQNLKKIGIASFTNVRPIEE